MRTFAVLVLCLFGVAARAEHPFDVEGMDMADLFLHASCYGSTEVKRERRGAARAELTARGPVSLRYLMDHMHLKNMWISLHTMRMVGHELDDEVSAEVLLDYLDHPEPDTRKMAAYFLGACETPEHAARVRALLADEKAAGAAGRTLGKWGDRESVDALRRMLSDEKEGRRIVAANALRDIGDASAAPELVAALEDPVFTVRKCASRALAALGSKAERALVTGSKSESRTVLRELVPLLGRHDSFRSRSALRRLRSHPDETIAADARQRLRLLKADDE